MRRRRCQPSMRHEGEVSSRHHRSSGYCNTQIHQLTQAYPEFQKHGIQLVAISVDKADESAKTKALYTIPFPILSDPDLDAHRAYRVMHEASQEEIDRLAGFGMDLEAVSGRQHHTIAIPSMFLLDKAGVVRWAHVDRDYKVRPSTEKLLEAVASRPAAFQQSQQHFQYPHSPDRSRA